MRGARKGDWAQQLSKQAGEAAVVVGRREKATGQLWLGMQAHASTKTACASHLDSHWLLCDAVLCCPNRRQVAEREDAVQPVPAILPKLAAHGHAPAALCTEEHSKAGLIVEPPRSRVVCAISL